MPDHEAIRMQVYSHPIMNIEYHTGEGLQEIRVLIACDADALPEEREMLEREVFPELRRLCAGRGIVFTDIDLLRHAGQVSQEHLLRSCFDEIHRNHPFILCLLGGRENIIGAAIVDAAANGQEIAERTWLYARSVDEAGESSVAGAARERGLRLRQGWNGPQELAAWVRGDLLALLAGINPVERRRALERERGAHEAFAASRRIGSLARPRLQEVVDDHVKGMGPPLLILGPSGSGKSTLVAQWYAAYRLRSPDAFVILHHVGAPSSGQTGRDVAGRLIEEIRDRARTGPAVAADSADPVQELPLQLAHLGQERLVLLIDGVDQLADGAGLEWLPAFLPPNVRLVVTSTAMPDAAAVNGWMVHPLHGLTRNERLALGTLYTDRSRAGFAGEQVAHLVNDASIATPLAFRVRLEELRLKGEGGRRMGNAAHFAAAAGLEDLMARLVMHWEDEFGAGPISRLLTALAGARAGLTHRELAEYVGGSGLDLVDMLAALDLHLLRFDGRIRFHHDAFRRAVEVRYLDTEAGRRDLHFRLAALFADTGNLTETAWHLRQAESREPLAECLARIDVARAFVGGEREHELVEHWMYAAGTDAMVLAYTASLEAAAAEPARERIAMMLDVAAVFRRAGRGRDSLLLLERAAALAKHYCADDVPINGAIAAQLAPLLAAAGNLRESEEQYRSALAALRVAHGEMHPAIARVLGELAGVLAETGRRAEAEGEYRAALSMMEWCGATGPQIASAVNDLATVLHESGRYAEAEALYRRALDLWASCGGEAHPDAVATVSNLAALHFDHGEHAAARAGRERVVQLWERALGGEHPIVATALANLATQITRDDPDAALPLLERARAIHEAAYSSPTHETAILLYTIGRAHYYAGRLEAAEISMRHAYELQRELLGVDHVDTAVTLSGLATLLRDRGDYMIAEHLLRQALDILERLLGPRHPRVTVMLTNLARLARRRGEHATARQLALQARENLDAGDSAAARELHEFLATLDADQAGSRPASEDS